MTPGTGPWAARTDGLLSNYAAARATFLSACILCCRRFTSLQQTRLVSQDADRSRRSLCAPLCDKYSTILEGSLKLISTLRPPASLCRARRTAALGGRVLRPWRRIETTC